MGTTPQRRFTCLLAALAIIASACGEGQAVQVQERPRRILITNDNGIDDKATLALARALAGSSEVTVVAPATDRSGTSNYMASVSGAEFGVESREVGPGITAFAVEGYPADCVAFALAGPMRDEPPDLVVSGINGGPNLADAWLLSGTIGAARTAAYLGVPAVAISGVEDDEPAAVRAVVDWVVRFLDHPMVRNLTAPEYLTVSLPVGSPEAITGVEITRRARGLIDARVEMSDAAEGGRAWRLAVSWGGGAVPEGSDVAAVRDGKIAIVPARAGEHDADLAARLDRWRDSLPAWR